MAALQKAVPTLTKADIASMQEFPDRSFDPAIMQVRSRVPWMIDFGMCSYLPRFFSFASLLAHVFTLFCLHLQEPALYRLQEAVQHYGEGAS